MKRTDNFEKFVFKKKNSAIKEQFRQEKKKWKKEKAEAIASRRSLVDSRRSPVANSQSPVSGRQLTSGTKKLRPKINPDNSRATKPASSQMPLNKFIAHTGLCSRRDAAELVKKGKVQVNGAPALEPGYKVTTKDEVTINGKKLFLSKNLLYILLNKPKDYITTVDDPHGRKTVVDLVRKASAERVYPVGRLDRNTTGVLLLTNDGELAQQLAHPSNEVKKVYEVKLDRPLQKKDFESILAGIQLEDGPIQPDGLAYADTKDKSIIGIEIHSGRNRIVRRIFEHFGYKIKGLDRVMFANLTKKNVERGKWRILNEKEIRLLKFLNTGFIKKKKTGI
jgi:23S rRNA pseudouridine2605 synthase